MDIENGFEKLSHLLRGVPIDGKVIPSAEDLEIEALKKAEELGRQVGVDKLLKRLVKKDELMMLVGQKSPLLLATGYDGNVWLNSKGEVQIIRKNAAATSFTYRLESRKPLLSKYVIDTKPFENEGIFIMYSTSMSEVGYMRRRGPLAFEYMQGSLKSTNAPEILQKVYIQVSNIMGGRNQLEGLS